MRGAPGWALGAAAVVLTLVVATVSAGNIEEDIDGLWETTGGDMVRKLVMDMENDAVAAGRKLVRRRRAQAGEQRRRRALRMHVRAPPPRPARCWPLAPPRAMRSPFKRADAKHACARARARACADQVPAEPG